MRSFDPIRVGSLECDAWVAYYLRRWPAFLRAAFGLTRQSFGLSAAGTARGGWWVLRANQVWAPYPDNDPVAARRFMERFYRLVAGHSGELFDPEVAARLEVEWWRAHRELQHDRGAGDDGELVEALAALYSYVYWSQRPSCGRPPSNVPWRCLIRTAGSRRAASPTAR